MTTKIEHYTVNNLKALAPVLSCMLLLLKAMPASLHQLHHLHQVVAGASDQLVCHHCSAVSVLQFREQLLLELRHLHSGISMCCSFTLPQTAHAAV